MRSYLAIYDLETCESRTLLTSDRPIEAPNWAPDGRQLIVNGEGALFRVALDAPALEPIACHGLAHLNNDHGILPDGQTLLVCDSPARGTALIYSLPVSGGTPRRITDLAPSWFHGSSPDGARLAYTCVRDGRFGIATCPVTGGDESLLVTSAHHYDGPDYTPDGDWIWFNSDRSGSMALWRMREPVDPVVIRHPLQCRAIHPHPAPDGRHVLYLAYEAHTEGHPPGRDVELRLLDLANGTITTLVSLFGGQGTINVPCWAPDGKRFAYMHYARD